MQYMLMLYFDPSGWGTLTPTQQKQGLAAYQAYNDALSKAGVFKAGSSLQPPSTATTVRVTNGKTQVLDGPFVESKEQLGGYFIIDVPDLEAAIEWAARCPGASHGVVELRPLGGTLE